MPPTDAVTPARAHVFERAARRARQFPDLELVTLDVGELSPRDTGLALAIDHAIARRWVTLVCVLEKFLKKSWAEHEPGLQAALLVGAAQILFLDRVPDHAAINASVEMAKRRVRPRAGGMVNAVLRRVAGLKGERIEAGATLGRAMLPRDDGTVLQLTEPIFSTDPDCCLAQQTSHPPGLITAWRRMYGTAAVELALHSLIHPPIIVAGASATDHPHADEGFSVFTGQRDELAQLLASRPELRVQDPGSARPIATTESLSPALIADLCAGRGTKTRQLAALHPQAKIVASDVDPKRREYLTSAARDWSNVEVVDPSSLIAYAGKADLLVLDVPCSNTGVLARRPEAKYRYRPETLESLQAVQRQIVADTLPMLREDGHLLYATCSLDREENERQVEWITKWHSFRVVSSATTMPTAQPGDPPESYRDGGYSALLAAGATRR